MKTGKGLMFLKLRMTICLICSVVSTEARELPLIKTPWTDQVSRQQPLAEYPRPQLVRKEWINLNGQWDYAITDRSEVAPNLWSGKILVPFGIESALSGVRRHIRSSQHLWYRRRFEKPKIPYNGRLLLHFGGIDWEAAIYINGKEVFRHEGGYTPFTVDITDVLKEGVDQELTVRVWDPTESGSQLRGKQNSHSSRFEYTPVSGIWQTVWMEPVPGKWIDRLKITPTAELDGISVVVKAAPGATAEPVKVTLWDDKAEVATAVGKAGEKLTLRVDNPKLWAPAHPYLYDLTVDMGEDQVKSYAGLRRIEVKRDKNGFNRLFLNGSALFQYGILDQGYWPDGLYTAPTDEALRSDLDSVKAMGFNAIRKHQKVEPARWYYWCDKLGLMVWQDIPAGNASEAKGRAKFEAETKQIIDAHYNSPSVIAWCLFNSENEIRNYGFEAIRDHVKSIKNYDVTRLIDGVNGKLSWINEGIDSVSDRHNFPWPAINPLEENRACILGEFGGIEKPLPEHVFPSPFQIVRPTAEVQGVKSHYEALLKSLNLLQNQGLAAAIYVQLTDVEAESNGLLTYDRKVNKLGQDWLAEINKKLFSEEAPAKILAGGALPWRFVTNAPSSDWCRSEYDDGQWSVGSGPFESAAEGRNDRTMWKAEQVWLRRNFEHSETDEKVYVCVWNQGGAGVQVVLNDMLLPELSNRSRQGFRSSEISDRNILKNGSNVIGVIARQPPGSTNSGFEVRVVSQKEIPVIEKASIQN